MVSGQHRHEDGAFTHHVHHELRANELNSRRLPRKQISVPIENVYRDRSFDNLDDSVQIKDQASEKTVCCATITGSLLGAVLGGVLGLSLVGLPGFAPSVKFPAAGTVLISTCAGIGIGIISGGVISAVGSSKE